MNIIEESIARQHEYVLSVGGFGGISEADEKYNDMNREIIAAFKKEYGTAFLGKFNIPEIVLNFSVDKVVYELTDGIVLNFCCDFVIPRKDEKVIELIRKYNSHDGNRPSVDFIQNAIENAGGVILIWF